MFKNYLKVAVRALFRNKVFTVVNVVGLIFGMTCSLVIFLWVKDEESYDQFHAKKARIYRVMENEVTNEVTTSEFLPWNLTKLLKNKMPGIENATRISWNKMALLSDGKKSSEENGIYASADLFDIFSFPLLYGDYKALDRPDAILISRKVADKYFPGSDPIGKSLTVDKKELYSVAGVLQDIPANSSLQFDFVLPAIVFEQQNPWIFKWGSSSFRTFVLLGDKVSSTAVNDNIRDLLKRQTPDDSNDELFLQRYSAAYLHGSFENGKLTGGRIEYVRLFCGIAILILIMACINYTNLATAVSMRRAKEVGIRKTMGGGRSSLVIQFFSESILLSLIAALFAVLIVLLLIPSFNQLSGKTLGLPLADFGFWSFVLLVTFLTGLLAGSYPAFYMSSFSPATILKGSLKIRAASSLFRKGMLIFQFGASVGLIFAAIIIQRQIRYIESKQLGISKDNIVQLKAEGDLEQHYTAFKTALLAEEGIQAITRCSESPLNIQGFTTDPDWPGKPANQDINFASLGVDYDFLPTMQIQLLEGRNFSMAFSTDSSAYIINEAAVQVMGLRHPVGTNLSFWNGEGKIIGVVKDFHFSSMHNAIAPMILMLGRQPQVVLTRLKNGETLAGIKSTGKVWRTFLPGFPFEYRFLSEEFEQLYKSDLLEGRLVSSFAFLTIVISCIGLFGLSTFIVEQRAREISIRKVLGATTSNLVFLLSNNFLILLAIAEIIFLPISSWLVAHWLSGFAYRITINAGFYFAVILISFLMVFLTVGSRTIQAALKTPTGSLKNE